MFSLQEKWNKAQRRLLEDFQEMLNDTLEASSEHVSEEDFHFALTTAMKHVYEKPEELSEKLMTKPGTFSRWLRGDGSPTRLTRELALKAIVADITTKLADPAP